MDNNFLDHCETKMRAIGEASIGSMMIFEMCDIVKSLITDVNDEVLGKIDKVEEAKEMKNTLQT